MLLKKKLCLSIFLAVFTSQNVAHAYDREDYLTTMDATLNALTKATDEFVRSAPPHQAALEGYVEATRTYTQSLVIPSPTKNLIISDILKQK